MAKVDRVTEYAKRVVDGEIFCGRLHYLACKRHLDDLEKQIAKGNLDGKVIENRVQKILDLKGKYNLSDKEVPALNVDLENEKIEELIRRIRQL